MNQQLSFVTSAFDSTFALLAKLPDPNGACILLLTILPAKFPVIQGGNGPLLSLVGMTMLTVLLKLALFIAVCYLFGRFSKLPSGMHMITHR